MTPMDDDSPLEENRTDVPGQVPDAGEGGIMGMGPTLGQALIMVSTFLGLQILFGVLLAAIAGLRGEKPDVAELTIIGGAGTAIVMLFLIWRKVQAEGPAYREALGFTPIRITPGQTFWTIFTIYGAVRIASVFYAWAFLSPGEGVEGTAERAADAALTAGSTLETMALWLFVAGVGPMAEEVIFRGYLQSALKRRYGVWMAVAGAAAVFATVHFSLILWPLYFFLGIGFGAAYERTGSLKPAIALHMVNNAVALAVQASGMVGSGS